MDAPRMIETRGWLDGAAISEGGVALEGWVSSCEGAPIDGYRLFAAGRWLDDVRVQDRLASPDVARLRPGLPYAAACRFALWAPLEAGEATRLDERVAVVVPTRIGVPGSPLLRPMNRPVIPWPPEDEIDGVGAGGLAVAIEYFGYMLSLGGLTPESDVLDVGCGWGRLAYPLAGFLASSARCEGFDVVESFIVRAQQSFAPLPNFRFQRLSVRNSWYSGDAQLDGSQLEFPYEDASFDLVVVASVFTHLRAVEVRRYLAEIGRVLRPGGRCLATAFLLDDEARAAIAGGRSTLAIQHPFEGGLTLDPDAPMQANAHPAASLRAWANEAGLGIEQMLPGSWCGRTAFTTFQDLMVLQANAR